MPAVTACCSAVPPGRAEKTPWLGEGWPATRGEVMAAIDAGLTDLRRVAEAQRPEAVQAFERGHARVLAPVPEVEAARGSLTGANFPATLRTGSVSHSGEPARKI